MYISGRDIPENRRLGKTAFFATRGVGFIIVGMPVNPVPDAPDYDPRVHGYNLKDELSYFDKILAIASSHLQVDT